eukprot:gnl/Spiro4/7150_TR3724_c0_g1_i1.p1 gnl/Spiro4/7150_TR3724_c0_g1~~gnl/Spiro4/7150_TR3724_c0_g1_i1.p1  ORF type:complete len:550 (+),score=167.18 gnl/Spiro4/7150_TR3724_c0_g1_i1:76-1650(+)
MASGAAQWKNRDDWKAAKELEEARKAGNAPAEKDEEGNDINPHIPQYISQAPWYLNRTTPGLKHQRLHQYENVKRFDRDWYQRGQKAGTAATFRKGACTNCGAMTHKAKDCCERPRAVGAKFKPTEIAPDEVILPNLQLDFEGTHDRWNGYDPDSYQEVIERYSKTEAERRKMRHQEFLTQTEAESRIPKVGDTLPIEDETGDKDEDNANVFAKIDTKQRTSVRNLRIREDLPKYLRNLNPNSAYFDPKTRTMRGDPNPEIDPKERTYTGDNSLRGTGESAQVFELEQFAYKAYENGSDIHPLACGTQAELAFRLHKQKSEEASSHQKSALLDKYGGGEHINSLPAAIVYAQTDQYVEYSRDGRIIKGDEKQIIRSRFAEDEYINNHTSVWGSFWSNGQWGYACCHQFIKNSYCSGEAGKRAQQVSLAFMEMAAETPREQPVLKKEEEDDEETKAKKLRKAIKAEAKFQRSSVELDERKRKYNALSQDQECKVTEEQMEAYYLKRPRFDDPMANFVNKHDDDDP